MYCGKPAGSDEHIIASRFIEVLSEDPRGFALPTRLQMVHSSGQRRRVQGKLRKRKGKGGRPRQPTLEFTTRVCTECNNEWMNDIDDAAFVKVASMIRGHRTLLSTSDQMNVAAWIAKVAITGRFAHLEPDHVEKKWTDWLYKNRTALPHWHVWIGKYIGTEPFAYHASDVGIVEAEPGTTRPIPNGNVLQQHGVYATLFIGYLAIQILGPDSEAVPNEARSEPIIKIWPASRHGLVWPPANGVITDQTKRAFVERLGPLPIPDGWL